MTDKEDTFHYFSDVNLISYAEDLPEEQKTLMQKEPCAKFGMDERDTLRMASILQIHSKYFSLLDHYCKTQSELIDTIKKSHGCPFSSVLNNKVTYFTYFTQACWWQEN